MKQRIYTGNFKALTITAPNGTVYRYTGKRRAGTILIKWDGRRKS